MGSSETLGDYKNVMEEVDRKGKLYQNIKPARTLGIEPLNYPDIQKSSPASLHAKPNFKFDNRMPELMNETVAEELGLAGVFVDETFNILHAVGEFRKFIELPKKGFSINLLKMFPASVSVSIRSAARKALKGNERVLYKSMKLRKDDENIVANLLISPFDVNSATKSKGYLLLFIPKENEKGSAEIIQELGSGNDMRVGELEEELQETRQKLQTVVEEIETSNEELQATNEELLAANEELQSTNEELQSVNEELHTVNAELQEKIEDLASLNDDMDNLLTSTGIGTIFLDRNMHIRKFTPTVMEHFNLREIDINRPIYHFASKLGAEDNLFEKVQRVLDTGESSQQELQSVKGDWFLKRITPYLNNQKVVDGVVISFVDINEQKEAQKEFYYKNKAFEQLLEGNMAGFWDRMIQENTEYLSPSLKEMFGYEDHEMKNVPESWQKIVHPDDLPEVFEAYRKHVESKGEFPYDYTVRYYHKDGSIVWIYCRGKVIEWDNQGRPIRMVGCHVDITPLKTIEQDLYRSNRELEQFAYVASHDLKEPLNTIKDFVKLFVNEYGDKLDDNGHQYIEFISQAAQRMGNLVEGVLGYSRIGQSLEITTIDCNKVIADIQIDLHKRIKDTKTVFKIKKLPTIKGYHIELNSLFLNLVSNSMKFRKPGQVPKISISAKQSGQFWEFTFKDNGIGIEEKNKDKVFNIFQRLNNMDSYDGTGIGLAQCKKIVELHGGKIWVDSIVDNGSTFHFTIKK
ncbi:MAG: PAS domain-containing protein [Saonia sp.]